MSKSQVSTMIRMVVKRMAHDHLTGMVTEEDGIIWIALEGQQEVIAKHFRRLRDHKNIEDHSLISLRKINKRKFSSVKTTSSIGELRHLGGPGAVQSGNNIRVQ